PAIKWNITKIEVLNPIKWVTVRRNEVGKIASSPTQKQLSGVAGAPMGIIIENARQQRAGLFLKDVRYRIYGYFDYIGNQLGEERTEDDSAAKYAAMFERRARKGQCFHRPYLGCREFSCSFKLVNPSTDLRKPIQQTRNLGYMLYDMDFSKDETKPNAQFYLAHMVDGVINTNRSEIEVIE
ncbi:MAG: type I-C CRISPR-associated protein Cas5c, partial [Gallicola sp.]|nr:type I-C CRISPR-associated protein Cas5c [Gallicola sp.]